MQPTDAAVALHRGSSEPLPMVASASSAAAEADDLWCHDRSASKWSEWAEIAAARQLEEAHRKRQCAVSVHSREKTTDGWRASAGHGMWTEPSYRHAPGTTPPAISAATLRHKFQQHDDVREQLNRWWGLAARSCCPPEADGPESTDTINYAPFLQLMLRIRKALLPPPFDLESAQEHVTADWDRIVCSRPLVHTRSSCCRSLPRVKLLSLIFDIADGHCTSMAPAEYAAFLSLLLERVSERGVPPRFRPLEGISYAAGIAATATALAAPKLSYHIDHIERNRRSAAAQAARRQGLHSAYQQTHAGGRGPQVVGSALVSPTAVPTSPRRPATAIAQSPRTSQRPQKAQPRVAGQFRIHALPTPSPPFEPRLKKSPPTTPRLFSFDNARASPPRDAARALAAWAAEGASSPPSPRGSRLPYFPRSMSPNQLPVDWLPQSIMPEFGPGTRPSSPPPVRSIARPSTAIARRPLLSTPTTRPGTATGIRSKDRERSSAEIAAELEFNVTEVPGSALRSRPESPGTMLLSKRAVTPTPHASPESDGSTPSPPRTPRASNTARASRATTPSPTHTGTTPIRTRPGSAAIPVSARPAGLYGGGFELEYKPPVW